MDRDALANDVAIMNAMWFMINCTPGIGKVTGELAARIAATQALLEPPRMPARPAPAVPLLYWEGETIMYGGTLAWQRFCRLNASNPTSIEAARRAIFHAARFSAAFYP